MNRVDFLISGQLRTALAFVCVMAFFVLASSSLYLALLSQRGWAGVVFAVSLLPLAGLALLMRDDHPEGILPVGAPVPNHPTLIQGDL